MSGVNDSPRLLKKVVVYKKSMHMAITFGKDHCLPLSNCDVVNSERDT